jgi:hypothetical protein
MSESSVTEKFELGRLKRKRVRQICCRRLSGFTKHIKVLRDLVELLLEREKRRTLESSLCYTYSWWHRWPDGGLQKYNRKLC